MVAACPYVSIGSETVVSFEILPCPCQVAGKKEVKQLRMRSESGAHSAASSCSFCAQILSAHRSWYDAYVETKYNGPERTRQRSKAQFLEGGGSSFLPPKEGQYRFSSRLIERS